MSEPTPLEAIFFAALEKAPAQRASYLNEACAGDEDLRRRVERMLAAQAESASFLETPPSAVVAIGSLTMDQAPHEKPGTQIGPYKLLQQIGEGGMGVVYMAEQSEPVQRKVALKVIKPGMDSRQVIARFEAERQALAMMDHVNIARVLDAGTVGVPASAGSSGSDPQDRLKAGLQQGRPYFVMELVHGVPITKYCDDNRLTPRQRLELFVPVCQAIQHAHQKGIIHRDIKPSNVMVTLYDGKPVPKVIDFGVAKATEQKLTERTLFTHYGTMVGTLEYMSPEQAEMSALGVDTRSDIYSLGVLLYELLTGSTPLSSKRMKEAAYAEILRLIKEEEPPKPSTRLSESGEALASISAQRHMEPAKLSKLMRGDLDWIVMKTLEKDRNRRYETANGFAADVQRYLNDEPVQACPPSAHYRLQKFMRRKKRALATAVVLALAVLVVAGTLGWAIRDRESNADAATRERAVRELAIQAEVNTALKEAERWQERGKWPEALSAAKRAEGLLAGGGGDDLRERVRQVRDDLEMVLRLEEIRLLSSQWKDDKFDYETADRAYATAFGEYGINVTGLSVEEAAARMLARPGVAVALAAALDDWAWARSQKDKAGALALMALAQAADPDPWRRQVRQAVQHNDTKTLTVLAVSPEFLRHPATSVLVLARALMARGLPEAQIVLRQLQRQYPGDFWINFYLAETLSELGPPFRDEAVSFLRAALAVRPQSNAARLQLGIGLRVQGKLDEAIACYRRAIELDPKFAYAYANLGDALKSQGNLDEAIVWYKKAIKIDPKSAGPHTDLGVALWHQSLLDEAIACHRKAIELDPKLAFAHNNLGTSLADQGNLDEAIACYRRAIELNARYANAHFNLGTTLAEQKKMEEAIACYRRAIELDPKFTSAHYALGVALTHQKNLEEAIACYRRAIELDPKNALAQFDLGNALSNQKKLDEAIAAYHKAIELDPKYAPAHNGLGTAFARQGKLDEAITCFRKAIELDPKYSLAHYNLGNALGAQGKPEEAIACYRKAIEHDPKYTQAHINLGNAMRKKGRLDEAIKEFGIAIKLMPELAIAHSNLGLALTDNQQPDEAIKEFRTAIALDPKLATAPSGLGVALQTKGKLDEAIACFRKGIELDPKVANTHNNLGLALAAQGKLDEAIACHRKAIEIDPRLPQAHNSLGNALSAQGKPEEAGDCYRKAIELSPKDAPYHYNLANVLKDLGKLDEAIALYRKAIELAPKVANHHNNLGIALMDQGKVDEAVACYRKAMELDPKDANAHCNLGVALQAQKKLDEAIDCYRKAIELAPKHVNAHIGLGNILKDQGKPDEASTYYRRATELDPKSAHAYYGLGSVLIHKQTEEAIACFRRSIELDPKSSLPHTRNALGDILGKKGWDLAYSPDPTLWDPKRALEASKEAVELAPQLVLAWQYLGWVQYRAGNWKASIEALEKSCSLQKGGDSGQWIIMSLAHWKLANEKDLPEQERDQHKTEARRWYDQAVKHIDSRGPGGDGLTQVIRDFRLEAAELLGVKEKKD